MLHAVFGTDRIFSVLRFLMDPNAPLLQLINSKPRSRMDFCQAWNLIDFSRFEGTIWRNRSTKKTWSYLLNASLSSRRPPQYLKFPRQSNGEDRRFVPRDAAWRSVVRILRIQLVCLPILRLSWILLNLFIHVIDTLLLINVLFIFSMRPRLTNWKIRCAP